MNTASHSISISLNIYFVAKDKKKNVCHYPVEFHNSNPTSSS